MTSRQERRYHDMVIVVSISIVVSIVAVCATWATVSILT